MISEIESLICHNIEFHTVWIDHGQLVYVLHSEKIPAFYLGRKIFCSRVLFWAKL